MHEFQERKKWRKIIYSKWAIFGLLIILSFLSYSTINLYLKSRNAVSKSLELENELKELEKRRQDLESEITRLGTPSGEEEEIRKKFNVAKPEEETLVILEKKEENGKINQENNAGFFGKVWNFMKNIF